MKVKELASHCGKIDDCKRCRYMKECERFAEIRFNFLPCTTLPELIEPNHPIMEVEL